MLVLIALHTLNNRFDISNPNKKRNKLVIPTVPVRIGPDVLGELVSVICHRGDVNQGHFVSYHKVGDQWYLNDDSRQCEATGNPMEGNRVSQSETVEILLFKNNV